MNVMYSKKILWLHVFLKKRAYNKKNFNQHTQPKLQKSKWVLSENTTITFYAYFMQCVHCFFSDVLLHWTDVISGHPYIFAPVQKIKIDLLILFILKKSKALSRLCKGFHFKMTGRSCTDEVRVKVHSFQKSHFLVWYKIFLIYVIHLCWTSLKL